MTAFRLAEWGRAEFVEMPVPRPAPGEVLVEVAAVGLCHTDLHFMHAAPGAFAFEVPFILGHETAGRVVELGLGVAGLGAGDAVVVADGPRCWRCPSCLRGEDNLCVDRTSGRGWGQDGGMAPYLTVPAREVVPLTSLDPILAAPLADAGVTSYHAVNRISPRLRGRSTAIVIGVGGLGGFAVQFLRQLTSSRVIAVDSAPHRLAVAQQLGADVALTAAEATEPVLLDLTQGMGADAVFDFVGTSSTMELSLRTARPGGAVAIVGAAGGTTSVGWGLLPSECELFIALGGTTVDLHDVVALAEASRISIEVECFPFDQVVEAYAGVEAGTVHGRAVVTLQSLGASL
jgi:alcohol dehydrogenase, propanol-preferring